MSSEFHVSPSQLDKFLHCQRSWGARYIAGLPEPPNQYAERGTAVHKVCEDWILSAKPPDLTTLYGRIAYPAIKCIPAPRTNGLLPERKVDWTADGVAWNFIKDLEFPGLDTHIWDYKTTSNLMYQKTPDLLVNSDPAGIVYAAHAFELHRAKSVTLEWLYLTASPPHRCLPVIARPAKQHCLERFAWLNSVAKTMIEHRKAGTNWLDLEPGPSYCNAFGGCPHRAACNLSPIDEFRSMLSMSDVATVKPVETAGFLAAISKFATNGQTPAQPVAPAPIPRAALVEAAAVAYPEREIVVVPDPPPVLMPWQKVVPSINPTPAQVAAASLPAIAAAYPGCNVELAGESVVVTAPVIPDLVLPQDKPKRHRRTKAEMAAARANSQTEVIEPQDAVSAGTVEPELVISDEAANQYKQETGLDVTDRYSSRPVAPQPKETYGVYDEAAVSECCIAVSLLERVVLALCANPGCAAMQSVDIVSKARAIVTAIEAE